MATPIADLFISVSSDVSSAVSGLASLETRLGTTTEAFKTAAPAGQLLAGAGAAIGVAFASSIGVAADFEHQMSGVKAVLDPADVATFGAALTNLALQLGKDTVFSASEAAAGIEELIKAGVSATDVMDGAAAAALSLAAATGIPVADAATLAAQAMNIFSKTADDLGKKGGVVDFLAGTANASAASMSDLSFGLQAAGTVAATIGLSFEDTATAIGLFANNGLRGSDAGTSLKTMLVNLIPSTDAAGKKFMELGLVTADGANAFFDATGKAKGLGEISQILQETLKDMGDEQQVATLKILFGTDAMRAASILSREGAAGFDTLRTSIESISAADAAKVRMDNLNGSMQQLGGSFEVVQITIGNLFLPVLRALADAGTSVLNFFSQLPAPLQNTIIIFTGIAGAVAALVGGFVLMGPFLASLSAAFAALGGILSAVALPLAALVAASALLVIAWQNDFGGIQEIVATAWANVQVAFANALTFIQTSVIPVLLTIGDVLGNNVAPAIGGFLSGAWSTLQGAFGAAAEFWSSTLLPGLQAFGEFFGNTIAPAIGGFLSGAWDTLLGALNGLSDFWNNTLQPSMAAFADFFGSNIAPAIGGFVDGALNTLQGAINGLAGFWADTLAPAISNVVDQISNQAGPAFSAFADFVANSVVPALQTLAGDTGAAIVQFFGTDLPNALSGFATQVESLGPLLAAFTGFLGAIFNVITALGDLGFTALQGLFENVLVPGFAALGDALAPLAPVLQPMTDTFGAMATNLGLIGEFVQPLTQFFTDATGAFNTFADGIRNFQLPDWLRPSNPILGGGGATQQPASFPPVGGNGTGTGGPLIVINTLNVGTVAEQDSFLQQMADVILASTRRVTPPPPGVTPVLS